MAKAAIRPGATLVQEFTYTQQQLPTNKPIVQYIRQSSAGQVKRNKQSYELQDSDLRHKLTRGYGWPDNDEMIIKIDTDQGKSGTKRRDERTGLDRLYTLLETGKAGAIAAFDVSRLYRVLSRAEYGGFCDMVLELGIPVVTNDRIFWPNRVDNDQLNDAFKAAAMFIEEIIKGKLNAGRNRHIQFDASYGGHNIPMGYIVAAMGDELATKKSYTIYKPHAVLIRWLFKRYRELNGNLPMLVRELERMNFRFPPFEQDIAYHVGLREDIDGSFPLRTRESVIGILTNNAYIGWYQFNGVIVSKENEPIVPMDDFLFAFERLSSTSLDGTETQERKPRERRYGGKEAILDGIVTNNDLPVYVLKDSYTARTENANRLDTNKLVVDVTTLDEAYANAFFGMLRHLPGAYRETIKCKLAEKVKSQSSKASKYIQSIARIDKEIKNEEMAQRVSKGEGDEKGYSDATKQLVQLRRDRTEIKAKLDNVDSEAADLAESQKLLQNAHPGMPIANLKTLAKTLVTSANMTEVSTHFIRLDVSFGVPINCGLSIHFYRANGSRVFWDNDKENYLRQHYATTSAKDIMAALPNHSWNSIRVRASELGLKRTLPGMNYDALTYSDMALMQTTGARTDMPVWSVVEQVEGAIQVLKATLSTDLSHASRNPSRTQEI